MARKRNAGLSGVTDFHVRQANSLFGLAREAAQKSISTSHCTKASDLLQHARFLYGQAKAHVDSVPVASEKRVQTRAAGEIQRAQRDLGACLRKSK